MKKWSFKSGLVAATAGFGVIVCMIAWLAQPVNAQINDELVKQQEDARLYLEMIDILKDVTAEEQIAGWDKFMREHPDSYFKEEIQSNLDNMKTRRSIQEKSREEEDSRIYFKSVEQAASLPLPKQIELWERFLKENPDSIFANEARTTMNRLKEEQRWGGGEINSRNTLSPIVPPGTPPAGSSGAAPAAPNGGGAALALPVTPAPAAPVVASSVSVASSTSNVENLPIKSGDKEYLDPDHALFLAAVPGAIIPGLGHFYAHRPAMGGFIAVVRIIGLGLLGVGAYRSNSVLMVPGGVMAGASYFMDVFMAPIEARNYNYSLDPLPAIDEEKVPQTSSLTRSLMLTFRF
jgi:hypothetical protein